MINEPVPHHYPKKPGQWWPAFFDWAYANVLMGLLPLFISVALIAFSKGPFKLPSDLALSLVVLTMTIAATGMDSLKEYHAETGKDNAHWVRRGFIILLIFGGLLAAVCTPSDIFRPENVNQTIIVYACALLLLAVMPLGFISYILGLKSRDMELNRVFRIAFERLEKDTEYLQRQEAREQQLQAALAAEQGSYNGVRL